MQPQRACHDTLDFVSVPGFHSAIHVFALTHSRRIVIQRWPWLMMFSSRENPFGLTVHVAPLDSASSPKPHPLGFAHACRSLPRLRRAPFPRVPLPLTHDLPSSFALAAHPVHLAESPTARFLLDCARADRNQERRRYQH